MVICSGRLQCKTFPQEAGDAILVVVSDDCLDGSVEVSACGEAESINVLAEWLQRGPPMAEVKTVSPVPFEGICPGGFTTR